MSERTPVSILVALSAVLFACGEPAPQTQVRAGDLTIGVTLDPSTARAGENTLHVALRDAAGAPVANAHVEVDVTMGAMGAMPAMGGAASVEPMGKGDYDARFTLDMGGTWQVAVRVHGPDGSTARAEGSLTIGTPGLRLAAVGAGSAAPAAAARDEHPGEFHFDESRLRQIGIRSEPARREPFAAVVRAAGRVTWDETTLHDVTLRVGGFAGRVEADSLGAAVEKGALLFELYSPELYAAQREYLEALRARSATRGGTLAEAAGRRLRLWGLDAADLAAIAKRGTPQEYVPIRAPVSGIVVEKEIVAGGAVAMGQRVYRIAPIDRIWIEAELFESELAGISVGTPAEVTLDYLPGRRFEARVAYLYPSLQPERRTARVRLVLANPDGSLRPDMYATVTFQQPEGTSLSVPDTAVLHAGDRRFVFLDLGAGRLRPQRVETGRSAGGRIEILSGLEAGQPVVVAGTFLVAGESRLRAALESW